VEFLNNILDYFARAVAYIFENSLCSCAMSMIYSVLVIDIPDKC
jgi:hypothetical protein